jgi:uncharacterized protein
MDLVISALFLGLAGSTHCLLMCGPLLATVSLMSESSSPKWTTPGGYCLGRLTGYGVLGFFFGTAGAIVNKYGAVAGLPQVSMLIGGPIMILLGLASLLPPQWRSNLQKFTPAKQLITKTLSRFYRAVIEQKGHTAAWVLGLMTAFMPCGLLFAVYGKAASLGHPVPACLFMLIFAVTTSPALLLVARLSQWARLSPSKLQKLAAISIIILGLKVSYDGLPAFSGEDGARQQCEHCH